MILSKLHLSRPVWKRWLLSSVLQKVSLYVTPNRLLKFSINMFSLLLKEFSFVEI